MAEKWWLTPNEVRDYSEVEGVKNRSDEQLYVDITRAKQYVMTYTHNNFTDCDEIPAPVKTAALILAENYGRQSVVASRDVKSETFDDYSYTVADTSTSIEDLGLAALLDEFVKPTANNSVTMRIRKL